MPTTIIEKKLGKEISSEIDLTHLFPAEEGVITQYYGRIGSGKTYTATADVLKDLRNGYVVYTNWPVFYNGFDERESIFHLFRSIIFPFVKRFYFFPPENLKRIAIDEHFIDTFSKLTDCKVYLDEGHVVFDSYEMAKMSIEKRTSVLHTRHFNRTINIISQRPSAIHVTLRANVNIFYKCEKILQWPFLLFRKSQIQDVDSQSSLPDEEKILSRQLYFARKQVMQSYDTQYLRDGMASSQTVNVKAFELNIFQRILQLSKALYTVFFRSGV